MYTRLFVLLFINVTIRSTFASRHRCDSEKNAIGEIQEGLLGETNLFPWLGVLKVYIRDEGDIIEALTGIVFITHTHALANAHEIAKIPEWIFKNIEAMFIPFHGKPWHVRILNYILHPEYRKATINTIALLTLKAEKGSTLPLLPVCWTRKLYRNTEDLYIAGFTDEFVLLEKFVYKATNEDITSCDQFYEQEELNLGNRRPVNYVCVSTTTVKVSCVWDTGNALISNNTGYWVLVGFGVNGPGCSAPGRFIDILHYLPWIWSVVRAGMKTDTDGGARRADYDLLTDFSYQFDTEQHHYLYYEIQKISPTETVIHINEEKGTEKCYDQIYREITEIKAPDPFQRKTYVTYKLSIYDLHYENITCVRIKLNAATDQHAYLFVEKYIEHPEGAAHTEWGDTPQDILQYYPLRNESALKPKQKKNPADWTPGPNLKPESMRYPDTMTRTMIENHNVYMKFTFSGQASYDIKIYAKPHPDPLHLRPIELNDRIGTIYYNEQNKSDILACTDTAYQHGKVVAPVNTVTLYTMALKAAVFHATHITSCAVFVCDGDARKFSIDEIDQSVEEHTLKMLVTQIEYPTFQRIIDDSLKAKKKQEDLSKSATVTATGNGTAYIPEPYDIQRPANATSFGIGDVKTRIRVFDNYTTMETDITARVFSNHSTPFGLYVIRPRTYTLHRWCIIPLENSTIPRCYSGDEYHDDNIPPEYSNIG